jgi:ubiquinone/menaquinone biosynthesis C-methylase UbiE
MIRRLVPVVFVFAACAHEGGQHQGGHHQHSGQHRFDDAEAWAKRFENPSRDAWQKPDEVIAALALAPDAKVADIGAGTGYFPVRLARAVPQGHVYGVDVESAMVKYLAARAEREKLGNLSAVLADFDDAKLPEAVDLVILVNTYHHIDARPAYFKKLQASVKPGGRLAIVDFTRASKMGPPADHKVPPEQVRQELQQAGWTFERAHDFLPEQFFYVFTRG